MSAESFQALFSWWDWASGDKRRAGRRFTLELVVVCTGHRFPRAIITALRGVRAARSLSARAAFGSRYANTALNLEMPICINILVSDS